MIDFFFLEGFQNDSGTGIDLFDPIAVFSVTGLTFKFFAREEWEMDRGVWEVEEERLFAVGLDKF